MIEYGGKGKAEFRAVSSFLPWSNVSGGAFHNMGTLERSKDEEGGD